MNRAQTTEARPPEPRRARERSLLARAAGLLVVLWLGLAAHRVLDGRMLWAAEDGLVLAVFLTAALLLHYGLTRVDLRGDEAIVPIVTVLMGLGVLLRLRLAPEPPRWSLDAQWVVEPVAFAALAAAVWICRHRLHWLDAASWVAGLLAPLVIYALIRHGVRYRGALYGPGLTTPSEVLKPLLVIFVAGFLKCRRTLPELAAFAAVWVAVLWLLKRQNDLGLMVILGAMLLSMFFIATGRSRYLLGGLALGAAAAALVLSGVGGLGGTVAARRLSAWLDPWESPLGAGYQTVQALFAVRAGGWDGAGLGGGFPRLTPLVESDFAYAGLAEEFGLLGCLAILLLYLSLYRRGFRIGALSADAFRRRLAIGCTTILAVQTLINIGGVLRLAPITGITLPFVSHGGSSLVVSCVLIGLVLAVGHDVETAEPPSPRERASRDED